MSNNTFEQIMNLLFLYEPLNSPLREIAIYASEVGYEKFMTDDLPKDLQKIAQDL